MNILVTGSVGFIGYALTEELLSMGHSVVGIDNHNDYYDPKIKTVKSNKLNEHKNYYEYIFDLSDYSRVYKVFEINDFDLVIHLGAQAGVRYSLEKPQLYIDSNVTGTLNIFEACKEFGVKKCIFASSSSVYGGIKEFPWREDMDVSCPVSLYASTKKMNELLAYNYNHLYGISMIGLRFFTVYGPGGRPDMMLWKLTKKIINDEPIDVYNHGDMYRDFTYIDDIVNGIISCIDYNTSYDIFNLGNNKPQRLLDVINILEREIGKTAKKNLMDIQPGDVHTTYADITKAQMKLNYTPMVRMEEGIRNFIEWYRKNEI